MAPLLPFAASCPARSRPPTPPRKHTTPDKYSNFEVAFQETMLANFTSCSRRQNSHVETTFLIIDLEGLSMWHCGKATLSFLSAMSKTAADHYPETMGRTYVRQTSIGNIHPPRRCPPARRPVRPFSTSLSLSPPNASKFEFRGRPVPRGKRIDVAVAMSWSRWKFATRVMYMHGLTLCCVSPAVCNRLYVYGSCSTHPSSFERSSDFSMPSSLRYRAPPYAVVVDLTALLVAAVARALSRCCRAPSRR